MADMALGQLLATNDADTQETLLRELVETHSRFVFKVAYSVLRNREDAEDAVQETFLRVLRHQRELPEVRDVRGWLARIAWRIAVDRRTATGTAVNTAPNDEDLAAVRADAAGAEQRAISAQMLEIAQRLIDGLPADLRDVLTLAAVEEMTSAEIATVLGIRETSVRTRLFRARQLLKQKMAALLEGNSE